MPTYERSKLPQAILDYCRVATHIHPGGNSQCSGQQTISDIATVAEVLGYDAAVVTPHSGNPAKPYRIEQGGPEAKLLEEIVNEISIVRYQTQFDIRFGLETNTIATETAIGYEIDSSPILSGNVFPEYLVMSLHGDADQYRDPQRLMAAYEALCRTYRGFVARSLGHATRYLNDVSIDWAEVAEMAACSGVAIELNLNLWFKETGQLKEPNQKNIAFFRRFFRDIAGTSAMFVIGGDEHNAGMWTTTTPYGGWELTVERHLGFIEELDRAGITPERIHNSSIESWIKFVNF